MPSLVRTVAGGLVLAIPAVALAAALVGRRERRLAVALRLGLIAALPGVAALVWLQRNGTTSLLVRITVLLGALVPGYVLAGWLALRAGSSARPAHHRTDDAGDAHLLDDGPDFGPTRPVEHHDVA